MKVARRLSLLAYRSHACQNRTFSRSIATHTYSHHATALSILPSSVDTASGEYKDNTRRFGELLVRMQELHSRIEKGGTQRAREKHVARGKMLPREYVEYNITMQCKRIDRLQSSHCTHRRRDSLSRTVSASRPRSLPRRRRPGRWYCYWGRISPRHIMYDCSK